jgi:hypothetical protein
MPARLRAYYGYYDNAPQTGALKFDTHDKNAEVYVNGAYAGTVGKLKKMHLQPGSYDIEVRDQGRTELDQKVYNRGRKNLAPEPRSGPAATEITSVVEQ